MDLELPPAKDGPVFVIGGAAGGIGTAIAQELDRQGRRQVLADADLPAVTALSRTLRYATPARVDLTEPESVAGLFDGAGDLGRLGGYVHCHSINRTSRLESLSPTDWDRVIHVNLSGPLVACTEAGRRMCRQGTGSIVAIGSTVGRHVEENHGAMAASMAALNLLIQGLAKEVGPHGVRANVVAFGTPEAATGAWKDAPSRRPRFAAHVPLGRPGQPADAAAVTSFLLSQEASFVTGQVLTVDGGATITSARGTSSSRETGDAQ